MTIMAKGSKPNKNEAEAHEPEDNDIVAFQVRIPSSMRKAIEAFRDDFKKKHRIRPSLNDVGVLAFEELLSKFGYWPPTSTDS